MRIVVDTNVVISGVFFGGMPSKVLIAIASGKVKACATSEIIDEYNEIIEEMILRKQGHLKKDIINPLIASMEIIERKSIIKLSRDPDDDKFLECAKDGKALYIVSGDKDLLTIENYEGIEIITAKEFCEKYLDDK